MRKWIRFSEPRAKRFHALLAENTQKVVTICGRAYDRDGIRETNWQPQARCKSCASRLAGRAYLIPKGPEVDRLLSPQLRLLENREQIREQEARVGKTNRLRMTLLSEQRERREQRG